MSVTIPSQNAAVGAQTGHSFSPPLSRRMMVSGSGCPSWETLGAGKTTRLLQLATGLLTCAEDASEHPILVLLNLSSWANKK
jgi:hypothetical protein